MDDEAGRPNEKANRSACAPKSPGDPKLRAVTESILAMPVADRIRQLEAEADFFGSVRSLDD